MQKNHVQAWLSEFAGTAILLFVSVLVARWLVGPDSALASAVPGSAARAAVDGVIIGAAVGVLIISPLGRRSGGHFNPAVSVTMWLLRALPGHDAGAYIVAQLSGSLAGVLLGRAVLGAVMASPQVHYAAIQPAAGWPFGAVLVGEAISIAILMAIVVAVLDRPALARWTPAVVAAGVAVLIFVGGLTSGGSFNPARQLAPLLLAGRLQDLWAYLLGPVVGAVIVAMVINALGLPRPLSCSLCPTLSGPPPKPMLRNRPRHEQQPEYHGPHARTIRTRGRECKRAATGCRGLNRPGSHRETVPSRRGRYPPRGRAAGETVPPCRCRAGRPQSTRRAVLCARRGRLAEPGITLK